MDVLNAIEALTKSLVFRPAGALETYDIARIRLMRCVQTPRENRLLRVA